MAAAKELRILYAHSGNQCAFEGCISPIFEDSGTLTGECAHIKAQSKNGPRYDEQQTPQERDGHENLILLCSRHHTIIDQEVADYPVERLLKMKQNHEDQYSYQRLQLKNDMLQKLIISKNIHIKKIEQINSLCDEYQEHRCQVDINADILDTFESLHQSINSLIEFGDMLIESPNTQYSDMINDYFNNKAWIKLNAQSLLVRILELKVEQNNSYYDQLSIERVNLEELHKNSFVD